MTAFLRSSRAKLLIVAMVLGAAAPAFFAAHQVNKARRFEMGSMDADFLDEQSVHPRATMMEGPIRHEDGSVDVIDFYGRLTPRRAEIHLPYHAKRAPLELFLRCHRFGLEGTVSLTVNGEHLDDFVFVKTSYPWAGIRTIVPQSVAERGPLVIELVTEGGDTPPGHLPAELGVGLDWIDVVPMSEGADVIPTGAMYVAFFGFVLAGFVFALVAGFPLSRATAVLVTLVVLALVSTALFPVATTVALARLWLVFALALVVHVALTRLVALPQLEARFVSSLVAVAALFHSLLMFFPNHLPPDVPLHSIQISWLESVDLSYTGIIDYAHGLSRGVTTEAVLMGTGESPGGDALPTGSYDAPYPPFFYMLAYGVSGGGTHLRFALEFLAVAMAALMLVVVYLIARAIWSDETISRIAALLFALEISVWHHANRGHAPGIFGALFVLVFLWFLVRSEGSFRTRGTVIAFALLTAAVALCYTVALIQISLFVPIFTVLVLLSASSGSFVPRMLIGFSVGIAIAIALFYAPYVVEAVTAPSSGEVLLTEVEDYDPPATFYFLRNQMRDTARLLGNGHALYVLLSFVGLALLRSSNATAFHRSVLWAGVLTYFLILLLKDPAFIPRIFLHAKEDIFYAPIACLLVALPAARLSGSGKVGRLFAIAAFALLLYLSVRDKAWNTDTLVPQPLARVVTGEAGFVRRA